MKNILVLEDDKYCLSTLFAVLGEISNYNFLFCENVETAIHKFENNKVDLIICDLFLKKERLQGPDFLKFLDEGNVKIPIFILTGMEYVAFQKKGGKFYYENYRITKQIQKPIEAHFLLSHIQEEIGE